MPSESGALHPGDAEAQLSTQPSLVSAPEVAYTLGAGGVGLDLNGLLESVGMGTGQALASVLAGLAWIFDAIEVTVVSFLLPVLHCDFGLSNFEVSFTAAIVYVGMGFGAAFWSLGSDRYGRRIPLALALLVTMVFGILSAFALEFWVFVTLRFGLGFGIGGTIPIAISYFVEHCRVKGRGFYTALLAGWWNVGSVLATLLTWLLLERYGWRVLLVVCTLPGLLILPTFSFLGETPRFLLISGKHEETLAALCILAHRNNSLESLHTTIVAQACKLEAFTPADPGRKTSVAAANASQSRSVQESSHGPRILDPTQTPSVPGTTVSSESLSFSGDTAATAADAGGLARAVPSLYQPEPAVHRDLDALRALESTRLWQPSPPAVDLADVVGRLVLLRARAQIAAGHPGPSISPGHLAALDEPPAVPEVSSLARIRNLMGRPLPSVLRRFSVAFDGFSVKREQRAFRWFRRGSADEQPPTHVLFSLPPVTQNERGRVADLFGPSLLGTTWRIAVLWLLALFGYYALSFVLPQVYGGEKVTCPVVYTNSVFASTTITYMIGIPVLLVAAAMLEVSFLGRRYSGVLWLGFSLLATVGMAAMLLFVTGNTLSGEPMRVLLVIMSSVALNAAATYTSVQQVYVAEVYPTMLRGVGTGFGSVFKRIGGASAPLLLGLFLDHLSVGLFLVLIAVGLGMAAFVQLTLPYEPLGHELAEVTEPKADEAAALLRENSCVMRSSDMLSVPVVSAVRLRTSLVSLGMPQPLRQEV